MISSIILFIIIFCVIVVSHEFGHFIVARAAGIRVHEFTVGVGPKLLGFTHNGTLFCIRLLPFGGACIYDNEEEEAERNIGAIAHMNEAKEDSKGATDSRKEPKVREEADDSFLEENHGIAFSEAGVWARIATVLAGPVFNFILAYLLALIVVWYSGSSNAKVLGLIENYPAEAAGLKAGDIIVSMNGHKVHLAEEIYLNTYMNGSKDMDIEFLRDGERMKISITPKYNEETGRYLVGLNGYGEYIDCRNTSVFKHAAYEVRYGFVGTYRSLLMLITGNGSKDDLGGPVAMATAVNDIKEEAKPYGALAVFVNMVNLAMLLSVNLGILNLLPLPAIDGGRLLFMFIEAVRGKAVSPEKEGVVHLVGFIFLICLMAFVTYNDIMRLVSR